MSNAYPNINSQEQYPDDFERITNEAGVLLGVRWNVEAEMEEEIGNNWQDIIRSAAKQYAELKVRQAKDPTCREVDPLARFGLLTMPGEKLAQVAPGLWGLYLTGFRVKMAAALPPEAEDISTYDDPKYGLECVAQLQDPPEGVVSKYEAHVDQRATAVLVVDAPELEDEELEDDEGALVISNNPHAKSVEEIDRDATIVRHKPGTLFCFSEGRIYPHYTRPLWRPDSRRLTVALNYPFLSETVEDAERMHRQIQGV